MTSARPDEPEGAARRRAKVNLGDLHRVTPIARGFGFTRGRPVDRYYIEAFLDRHALAIRGRVLEFGDRSYTTKFGATRVTGSDVWQAPGAAAPGTIVGDLASAEHLPADMFDCIVCTQTLQLIFDLPAAARTLHRLLKPGGVLLASVPGISQTDDVAWGSSWCWGFTALSASRLFVDAFGEGRVRVAAYGNVLSSVAFLHGLAEDELNRGELDAVDPAYPLLVTVEAVKQPAPVATRRPPLVSVVIPCFNQANFLGEAVESVLDQTHNAVEVVVVDDGSPDNVAEVVARYPGLVSVRQTNQGLAAARNAGVAHANGDYLVFLDADDRLLPHAVEEGLEHLLEHPACAFVSGHHRLIDIGGAVLDEWPRPVTGEDRYEVLLRGNYISMCAAVLFRREVFDLVGLFDPHLGASEDYDLYLRIVRQFPVCDHGSVVAEYRRHGAAMTDDALRMLRANLRVLEAQRPFSDVDERHRLARLAGIAHWREYYGRRAAESLVRRTREPRQAAAVARLLLSFARAAPLEAARLMGRMLRNRMTGAV